MIIVSFDPASCRNLGWSVINIEFDKKGKIEELEVEGGTFVLQTVDTEENWRVLYPIQVFTDDFLQEKQPNIVIVEKTNNFAGGFISGQVSQCMGVILACCAKYNLDVKFIFPTHAKKVLTGNGRAKKSAIKKNVKIYLEKMGVEKSVFKNSSEHMFDAFGNTLVWLIDEGLIKSFTKNK